MTGLDSLYSLRSRFIVIGLTGRLGSGCTTVAELLTNDNFHDCNFPKPTLGINPTNEDRKYRIAYEFLEQNWKPYTLIRASDAITSYLLKKDIAELSSFLKCKYPTESDKIDIIINKIREQFNGLSQEVKNMFKPGTNLGDVNEIDDDKAYELFFGSKSIVEFSKLLKDHLQSLTITNGSYPYQYFGDNLRKTGDPYQDRDFQADNCYIIAKFIRQLIKINRNRSYKEARIVVDSIRNSMESRFFKERYSAFYQFAVNTEETCRLARLNQHYNTSQLKALDQEYTKDLATEERFYKQDIQTCIQVSDIYLHNPDEPKSEGDKCKTVKKDILRYLALILQPGIITPTPSERCMQIAYTAKYNSGCISRQVGAVVTDESFSLKSIGWNNTAEGQTPCLLRSVDHLVSNSDPEAYSEYEKGEDYKRLISKTHSYTPGQRETLKGRNVSFCFKDGQNCIDNNKNQVHTRSLHAEENAMLQIAKYGGEGLKNGFLFTTASPCELCSKKAYQLGIKRVFYIDPYPGISDRQILRSGVQKHQPQTELFVVGRAYHHLFEPFMAYKDELKTLLNFDLKKAQAELRSEQDKKKYVNDLIMQKEKIEIEIKKYSSQYTDQ
jgi:deoxycytidylate deaminase